MSVPVAVWNKIEALEQAHAELAAKVDALLRVVDVGDLAESPAPAPDPRQMCQGCNGTGDEYAGYEDQFRKCERCDGSGWIVPTAEPEPAPLDPVLVAIRDLYVLYKDDEINSKAELREEWRIRTGTNGWTVGSVDAAIRAYGRDGAR